MSTMARRQDAKFFAYLVGAFTLLSLLVTIWDISTVFHEQTIVAKLVASLKGQDLEVAKELSNQLQFQSRLTASLILSVLAGAITFSLALRGYFSSEENLKNAKTLSNDILGSMDSAVMTTDLKGNILSLNPFASDLFELENAGSPTSLEELGGAHQPLISIQQDVLERKEAVRDFDYRLVSGGHRKTLRASCTLLKNHQGAEAGLVFQIRDVTEKALIEEQLRRMERYMGLGTLAAGLQHEIKNPLNALTLHLQLLGEHLTSKPTDPEVDESMDIINSEVRRISKVLDGFRNFASVHTAGMSPVDVPALLQKLLRLLKPEADRKKIELRYSSQLRCGNINSDSVLEDEDLGIINADPTQLEQVFLNLALNGIIAMPSGGILSLTIQRQLDKLQIDVSDTGIGIPPEHHAQLFDPYFTTRYDGTGMGLAISDKFVRQHGGSIDFATGSDGTTFTVLLPIHRS